MKFKLPIFRAVILCAVTLVAARWEAQAQLQNHYKTWRVQPEPFTGIVQVKDQFMSDDLTLSQISFLSNPVRKVVFSELGPDTFDIVKPDNHLTWYRAPGRDTLIQVEYVNQLESTTVMIDSVKYLLVPTQKEPHALPESLDHYKAYRITNPTTLVRPVELLDQFDPVTNPELIDSLVPVYFCTPAIKNTEPIYDTLTHYVAYVIQPKRTSSEIRGTVDQFGVHSMQVLNSEMLLVPTKKRIPPPPPDTGKNHYKTWRIQPLPLPTTPSAEVKDQFMVDTLDLPQIEFLSNPVTKIVGADTFNITKLDNHLSWYKAQGRDTLLKVEYANQFESTTVLIDSVKYLLLPAQKSPHGPYDSLDHYKAYRIKNPQLFNRGVQLKDQFDLTQEPVTSLVPMFFLTPAQKNTEVVFDTITHYVAYSIDPKSFISETRMVTDQYGTYDVVALNSEMLLVPTRKIASGTPAPDTGKNHYKGWRITPQTFDRTVLVQDQFMMDSLKLFSIDLLSNPVKKVVGQDTFNIIKPDNHLTWYRAMGKPTSKRVEYVNQFESTTVQIDSVNYLLVPTQKQPHAPPESLDHYKAYRIKNPQLFNRAIQLQDQFDLTLNW